MSMNKTYHTFCRVISTLSFVCLLANNAFADCDSTANAHYPTITPPNYQGSAHTDSFDCAVNGSKQLTLEQINERAGYMPQKLSGRFYYRLGFNAAAQGITGASNLEVNNTSTNQTGYLLNGSNKEASNNFEMAFGYLWDEFGVDLEWLTSQSVSYSTLVTGVTPNFNFYSNVKGDALLLNLYWIFNNMYNVSIYGDGIIGYSDNTSTSYIAGGESSTTKWKHWAFGAGLGGRFNIISRLFADVKARYIFLGTTTMTASYGNNNAYIQANRTWLGASVCLMWLF